MPLFIALADGLFSEDEKKVFRRRNIAVDPEFADLVQRGEGIGALERPNIDLAATEQERAKVFGTAESGAEAAAATATTTPGPEERPALLLPDEIVLKNSQILRGRIVDESGGSIVFRLDSGFQVNVARDEVAEIRRANQ